jgi:hypothetical protein
VEDGVTQIRKSDAQLDAEAAQPLEERDLDAAIVLHRALYRADIFIARLHQRDGESGIGPPFSPPFENYLDDRLGGFPWSRALFWLRYRVCRSSHPEHLTRPEWGSGLCYRLVDLVVRREFSLDMARLELGLSSGPRSRRTLDSALLAIERRMEDQARLEQAKQSRPRLPAEWMGPAHHHRALGGLHAAECPQCHPTAA